MVSRYWEECTLNTLTHGYRYMLKHARLDLLASRSRPRATATGTWLLANCWLLVAGGWLLWTGGWLLWTGGWVLVTGGWQLWTGGLFKEATVDWRPV